MARNVPLMMRSRFRSVEHDHDTFAKTNDGRHTLRLSPFTEAPRSHDLNCSKELSGDGDSGRLLPWTRASKPGYERSAWFMNIGLNSAPDGLALSAKSTMNVGRSSC